MNSQFSRRNFLNLFPKVAVALGLAAVGLPEIKEPVDTDVFKVIDNPSLKKADNFSGKTVAKWDGLGNSWTSEDGGKSWRKVSKAPVFDNPETPIHFLSEDEDLPAM